MIYLDNAATSFPKAPGVSVGIAWHINNIAGNTGRSSYQGAVKNSTIIYETREKLAEVIGCLDSTQIIFTNNATHALNMVILGSVKVGEKILVSPLEHNSVMRPLSYLQQSKNIEIFTYKMNQDFQVDLADFDYQLKHHNINKVITTICSNVTGTIFPIKEISQLCSKHQIPLIVDAAQFVGYEEIDLRDLEISALCFPGHKGLLGPSGTGALWFREDFEFQPLTFGGTGSKSDSLFQPDFSPDKYESGTMNISGIYGLSLALDYILQEKIKNIREQRKEIIAYLFQKIKDIEELIIYSNQDLDRQIGVISFNVQSIPCSEVTYQLDRSDIAVRMGLHCASQAHKFLGTIALGGTVRLSPSCFTTKSEIDLTIKTLKEIIYEFKR